MSADAAMAACRFPEHLHPISQIILDHYLSGVLSAPEFLRFFSLPNSDYIDLAACLVKMIAV